MEQHTYSHDDPSIIWAAAAGKAKARGTFDDPFAGVMTAVSRARPGNTVVLKAGLYRGDVTIQNSGEIDRPIRIVAEPGASVQIKESSWFFYDACDFIVSGLCFFDAPQAALSVMGACQRNSFAALRFVNCGFASGGCSLFFGGSGGRCNVVQECAFEGRPAGARATGKALATVGIMIAEGEVEERAELNCDYLLRDNTLSGYDCGIVIGTRGHSAGHHGHVALNNLISDCALDGIRVNCGDTLVRGNVLTGCRGAAVSLSCGSESAVEDNRIQDCADGVRILGAGHTIQNNCLVRCSGRAIQLLAGKDAAKESASNVLVDQNTCIDCGQRRDVKDSVAGVVADAGTSCVIRRNVFCGSGVPYALAGAAATLRSKQGSMPIAAEDNIVSAGCDVAAGSTNMAVGFYDPAMGNFENDLGYGAQGWMARGLVIDKPADEAEGSGMPSGGSDEPDDEDQVSDTADETENDEVLARNYFFQNSFDDDPWPSGENSEDEEPSE